MTETPMERAVPPPVEPEPVPRDDDEPLLLTEPTPEPVVYLDEHGRVEMFVPEVGPP